MRAARIDAGWRPDGIEEKTERHRQSPPRTEDVLAFVRYRAVADVEAWLGPREIPPGLRPSARIPFHLGWLEYQPGPFPVNRHFWCTDPEFARQ
jgi:hypothetical protein